MPNINIYKGQSIILSGSDSYNPDGIIVSYLWSTGETTENITVTPEVDTTITLTVTDDSGDTNTTSFTINILKPSSIVNLVCYKGIEDIFDKLIYTITKNKYTHVGLAITEPTSNTITYLASRENFGVSQYTESLNNVDIYPITDVKPEQIELFYKHTEHCLGSMISDMGYPKLKRPNSYGSVEWVAKALNLGLPHRYTIEKLIDYTKDE